MDHANDNLNLEAGRNISHKIFCQKVDDLMDQKLFRRLLLHVPKKIETVYPLRTKNIFFETTFIFYHQKGVLKCRTKR